MRGPRLVGPEEASELREDPSEVSTHLITSLQLGAAPLRRPWSCPPKLHVACQWTATLALSESIPSESARYES